MPCRKNTARCSRHVRECLGEPQGITLSAHCHDDLGMAVANSLAAVRAGVRQIECTINGIGERAGNASLEEVAVALAVRKESFGVTTNINIEQLFPTSRMLTEITGAQVAPNKAVVGANAFAHEAGIHQDGIIKNPLTYEIISPRSRGRAFALAGAGKTFGAKCAAHELARSRIRAKRCGTGGSLSSA